MEQLNFYVIDSTAVASAPDDKTGSLNCFNDQSQEILWGKKVANIELKLLKSPTASIM